MLTFFFSTEPTAFTITFLLTNYPAGDPRLEAALAWEKVFIDFMKRWTANEMPASTSVQRLCLTEMLKLPTTTLLITYTSKIGKSMLKIPIIILR